MKKFVFFLILAMMATTSHALSFNWSSAAKAAFDGTTIGDGSVTGYLVYLGNTSTATYDIEGVTVKGTAVQNVASLTSGRGKGNVTGTYENSIGGAIGSDKFGNGSVFGMYATYTDSNGKQWVTIASNTYTVSGAADDGSVIDDASFSINWTSKTTLSGGQSATAGGGWTAVPEPSTAALALAGLALLLKRRNA